MRPATAKDQTRRQWNQTPCGTGDYLAGLEPESLDWFDAIRKSRYEVTDRWMTRVIPWDCCRGGKLLEIGHGIGSDLLTFAEHGALCHGIDITEEHHRLCRENFALHGRPATLKLCDAAAIDFPTASFDVVYSNGVLHHTPDTEQCLAEAWRVLRPGGRLILTLYHRMSAFHLVYKCLYHGLRCGMLPRLGYAGLMATIEHGADGVTVTPLVKTYTRAQLRRLLRPFRDVEITAAHLAPDHFATLGRLIPLSLARALEPKLGWYLVATARKRSPLCGEVPLTARPIP